MPLLLTAILRDAQVQTPDTKNFFFQMEGEAAEMQFKPGQHIIIQFEKEGRKLFHPYSLTSLPEDLPFFELCVKKYPQGSASVYIHALKIGEKIQFLPPRGNLFVHRLDRELVFIATGTGITPMVSMIRHVLGSGVKRQIWLFFGNRTEEDMIYRREFADLSERYENFNPVFVLSRPCGGWDGPKGYVQDFLEEYLQKFEGKDYYICGVPQMVVEMQKKLEQKGVANDCIFTEGWESGTVAE